MKQGRDTTQEERIQIVKDCLASGKNYGEMALKYKVSYQQVRTWTLRFEAMGEAGLDLRDLGIGIEENGRKIRSPEPSWRKRRSRSNSSSTSCIWRKWSVIC